jgi:hypothetical protein
MHDDTTALASLYFAHPQMFLVPVEAIGPAGLDSEFASLLRTRRDMDDGWIELFDRAIAAYFERVADVYARAPASWFPPRRQNVFVVTDPERTRPYYQPFEGSSWMVYASDFDPARSNLEYAVHQLVHAERLGAERQMGRAMALDLSWWLVRTPAEREAFASAAAAATRPDAAAFVAVADALPWIETFYHAELRHPEGQPDEPYASIKGMHLYVPRSRAEDLRTLVRTVDGVGAQVAERYLQVHAAQPPRADVFEALRTWLERERPPVRVLDEGEVVLWDPNEPADPERLRARLHDIPASVLSSLHADLEVVGARTRRFFEAARDCDGLPRHVHDVESDGGTWVDPEHRVMVYSLVQPGLDTTMEPAPPYHRLLLGARTMHEWGHLAADAGWIGLPDEARLEHAAARAQVATAYERLLANASRRLQEAAAEELEKMNIAPQRCGSGLTDLTLERSSDYLANLLMRELSPVPETEAYIRANVKTHVHEPLGPMQQLARYAYEYQYLNLSRMSDPLDYFMHSTWFSDYFIETGLVRRDDFVHLLESVTKTFATYRIDPQHLRI